MENIIKKKYTDEYYDFVYEVKKNAYKKYVIECWRDRISFSND